MTIFPRSYLTVYALLLALAAFIYSFAYVVYLYGSLRASRLIHKLLIDSVLGTTLRYVQIRKSSPLYLYVFFQVVRQDSHESCDCKVHSRYSSRSEDAVWK